MSTPYDQLCSEITDLENQLGLLFPQVASILKESYENCASDPELLANLKLQISILEQQTTTQ